MIRAVVLHSGGMDSSICLLLAVQRYGADHVVSVGVQYGQRHHTEMEAAERIAARYHVRREVIAFEPLSSWQESSLVNTTLAIEGVSMPNSFVPSRNGLFVMIASSYARSVHASSLYVGVMEQEGSSSGYPDCSRAYMDAVQAVIRLDLADPSFAVVTPLVSLSKRESLEIAHVYGELPFLLATTVTCYHGIPSQGCGSCPSCRLRATGLEEFSRAHPDVCL